MSKKFKKFFDVEDVDKSDGMKIAEYYGCIFDSTQPTKTAVIRRLNQLEDKLQEDKFLASPEDFEGEIGETCQLMLDVLEGKIDENGHRRVDYDEFSDLMYQLVDSIIEDEEELGPLKGNLRNWRKLATTFNDPNQRRGKCSKLRQHLVDFLPNPYVEFVNYEDMTYNQLRSEAKKAGLEYSKSPTKEELLSDLQN